MRSFFERTSVALPLFQPYSTKNVVELCAEIDCVEAFVLGTTVVITNLFLFSFFGSFYAYMQF